MPMLGRAPISSRRSVNRSDVNWPDSIGRRNTSIVEV